MKWDRYSLNIQLPNRNWPTTKRHHETAETAPRPKHLFFAQKETTWSTGSTKQRSSRTTQKNVSRTWPCTRRAATDDSQVWKCKLSATSTSPISTHDTILHQCDSTRDWLIDRTVHPNTSSQWHTFRAWVCWHVRGSSRRHSRRYEQATHRLCQQGIIFYGSWCAYNTKLWKKIVARESS